MFEKMMANFNYLVAIILFLIGFYIVLTKSNLIKKLMGLNIIETSLFLLIISIGAVKDGLAPIVAKGTKGSFVDPLPQALIIISIMIALGTTIFALSLGIKIYERYGTLDLDILKGIE
jgi:multicomponent Na+:H+ antiporter subunit C